VAKKADRAAQLHRKRRRGKGRCTYEYQINYIAVKKRISNTSELHSLVWWSERPESIKTWPRRMSRAGAGAGAGKGGLLRGQTTLLDCRAPLEMTLHLRCCPEIGFEPQTQSGDVGRKRGRVFLYSVPLLCFLSLLFLRTHMWKQRFRFLFPSLRRSEPASGFGLITMSWFWFWFWPRRSQKMQQRTCRPESIAPLCAASSAPVWVPRYLCVCGAERHLV